MIINSVISGGSAINVSIISSELFIIKQQVDESITIEFTYLNSKSLKGAAILFLDDNIVESSEVEAGSIGTFDIKELIELRGRGFYRFKLVVVDSESSSDKLEFVILYDYEGIDDFNFEYNDQFNGYVLSSYEGELPSLDILPVFSSFQGVLPVIGIGDGAFFNNDKLVSVVIPEEIKFIGVTAFFSCTFLESVTVLSEIPPVLNGDNVFDPYNPLSLLKIYVPAGSVEAYKNASFWDEYENSIFAIGG